MADQTAGAGSAQTAARPYRRWIGWLGEIVWLSVLLLALFYLPEVYITWAILLLIFLYILGAILGGGIAVFYCVYDVYRAVRKEIMHYGQ